MELETAAQDLIANIRDKGVKLWIEDGRLRFRAPKGIMTDTLRNDLKSKRTEIIHEINRQKDHGHLKIDKVHENDPFPLTDIQAAYLLGRRDAFTYGGVGCHGYLEFVEPGKVDVQRLEVAWNTLIQRHPMLRAVFDENGEQRVLKDVPKFCIDTSKPKNELFKKSRLSQRSKMSHTVYDGARWPLFNVAVTQGHKKSVIHLSFDLLIADFVSFGLILGELETLYDNPNALLAPIEATFRDYLVAAEKIISAKDIEKSKTWWLDRLSTLPPRPGLPIQTEMVAKKKPRFSRHSARLSNNHWKRFQNAISDNGLTCSAALLSAFCEVILKWSHTKDFTISLPLLDRQPLHPDVSSIVGDFTALTLFSANNELNADFLTRAQQHQKQLWADLDHRNYSGIEVAREIARNTGETEALFPVVFTSAVGQDMAAPTTKRWVFTDADYGITQTPQVWLDCQIFEAADGLHINWDYHTLVLSDKVVEDMTVAFSNLLMRLADEPSTWLKHDPVLLPPAQSARRDENNFISSATTDKLLHQSLVEQCVARPNATAILSPSGDMTYKALLDRASAIAAHLHSSAPNSRSPVAVIVPKSADQIAAAIAALLVSRPFLPIDTHQPEARREIIIKDAGADNIITTSEYAEKSSWPSNVHVTILEKVEDSAHLPDVIPASPADLAYMIYTGGSTGTPKGVMIRHSAAQNTLEDICDRLRLSHNDRVIGMSHLGFDLSIFDVFGTLSCGGTLVLPDPNQLCDPSHWHSVAKTQGVTVWNSVPAQMQMLADYVEANLENNDFGVPLRHVLLSGDWIPTSLPDRIWALSPTTSLLSLGGATEASIWSVYHEIEPSDRDKVSIPYGRPLTNQTLHVLDQALNPKPDFVSGDLYIGGQGLADGYVSSPDNAAFICHPNTGERLYKTGDMCRYLDNGELEFLGRKDLQVKIRGHRIELPEIEVAALAIKGIAAAAAVTTGDRFNRNLALAISPELGLEATSFSKEDIILQLTDKLPSYMIPHNIEIMDRLPVTGNNKIDRSAISALLTVTAEDYSAADEDATTISDLEKSIVVALSEVLGLPHISVNNDFLELGGNSLLAARAATDIRIALEESDLRLFSFDELLITILDQRTPRKIADYLETSAAQDSNTPDLKIIKNTAQTQTIATLILALEEEEAETLASKISTYKDRTDILSIIIQNPSTILSIDQGDLLEWISDTASAEIEAHLNERSLILLCNGNRAAWGLEIGRRLGDIGIENVTLVVFHSNDNNPTSPLATRWSEEIERFTFYPYIGDVIIEDGVQLNSETHWKDIALGHLVTIDDTQDLAFSTALDTLTQ